MPAITYRLNDTGHSIELRSRSWPIPWNSLLAAMLILSFACVFSVPVVGNLVERLSDDWYLRFDWWWRILAYFALFLGLLSLVTAVPLIHALRQLSFVRSIKWDIKRRSFQCTRISLLFFRRRQILAFDQIEELTFTVGEETGCDLPIQMRLESNSPTPELEFCIQDIDLQIEAIDFFLRVARHFGLSSYRVENSGTASVRAVANRSPMPGGLTVPEPRKSARYDMNQVSSAVDIPPPQVGEFRPATYSGWIIGLEHWEPGKQIRFLCPALTISERLCVGIAIGMLIAMVVGFSLNDLSMPNRFLVAGTAGLLLVPISGLVLAICYPRAETLMDFGSQQILWSRGIRKLILPFREIRQVVLMEKRRYCRPKEGVGVYIYQCHLSLETSDGRCWMITRNDFFSYDRDSQRSSLEPLALALSEALNVSWKWKGQQPSSVKLKAESASLSLIQILLIGIIGFFGWAYWQQSKQRDDYSAIAHRLEQLGTRATVAGIGFGEEQVFSHGIHVEAVNSDFDDGKLSQVLELLQPEISYGLDLSQTFVTNEGIKMISDIQSIRYLSLRGTKVTPEAIAILSKTQLCCIDLRDTSVRMEHLDEFTKLGSLRILLISHPDIDSVQVNALQKLDQLRAVLINDRQTTETWLHRINAAGDNSESFAEGNAVRSNLWKVRAADGLTFLR